MNILGLAALSKTLYLVTMQGTNGMQRADGQLKQSKDANTTSVGADLTTVGVKTTVSFDLVVPRLDDWVASLLSKIKWELLNSAVVTGAPMGRLNMKVLKNAVLLVTANGPARSLVLDAAFTEFLHALLTTATDFVPGDVLRITVEIEVTVAAATGTGDLRIHHDPTMAGNEAFLEIMV